LSAGVPITDADARWQIRHREYPKLVVTWKTSPMALRKAFSSAVRLSRRGDGQQRVF